MDAWQDLHAIHQLNRHLSHGLTFIEQSKARDVSAMACYATATLLDHGQLTLEQARQIRRDLSRLRAVSDVVHSLEHHERLFALDAIVYAGSSGDLEQLGHLNEQLGMIVELMGSKTSIDWNLVLRETNRGYDRLIAAARLKDREARIRAINGIEGDLRAWLAGRVSDATISVPERLAGMNEANFSRT